MYLSHRRNIGDPFSSETHSHLRPILIGDPIISLESQYLNWIPPCYIIDPAFLWTPLDFPRRPQFFAGNLPGVSDENLGVSSETGVGGFQLTLRGLLSLGSAMKILRYPMKMGFQYIVPIILYYITYINVDIRT